MFSETNLQTLQEYEDAFFGLSMAFGFAALDFLPLRQVGRILKNTGSDGMQILRRSKEFWEGIARDQRLKQKIMEIYELLPPSTVKSSRTL